MKNPQRLRIPFRNLFPERRHSTGSREKTTPGFPGTTAARPLGAGNSRPAALIGCALLLLLTVMDGRGQTQSFDSFGFDPNQPSWSGRADRNWGNIDSPFDGAPVPDASFFFAQALSVPHSFALTERHGTAFAVSDTAVTTTGRYTVSVNAPTTGGGTSTLQPYVGVNTSPTKIEGLRALSTPTTLFLAAGDRFTLGYDVFTGDQDGITYSDLWSMPGLITITLLPDPPSLEITGPRKSFRYRNRLRARGTSSHPISTLQAKWTGRSGYKTIQLGSATSWSVKIPKRILKRKRAVTVRVRGIDEAGNISSIVKRRYRRRPTAFQKVEKSTTITYKPRQLQ